MRTPEFDKVVKHSRERWLRAASEDANYEYLKAREELMTQLLKVMADHKLDAIVHKAVEHQPTLIADGIRKAIDGLTTIEEVLRVTAVH
jgi:type II secretory ATPase GspE/PulE/Tfp pilus assembly ATPase PilB-like protein